MKTGQFWSEWSKAIQNWPKVCRKLVKTDHYLVINWLIVVEKDQEHPNPVKTGQKYGQKTGQF